MKIKHALLTAMALFLLAGCSDAVYFKGLDDGDTVSSPLTVNMGACGVDVQKAGEEVEGAGHHHLIIDGDCIAKGQTVPKDATHKHFGKGQTETSLELSPGKHTLALQFANGVHSSYGKELCEVINITVK